jgi:hypothetical protein
LASGLILTRPPIEARWRVDGPAQSCLQPPAGLTAWWPLDEATGSEALDLAGVRNTGRRPVGVGSESGQVGLAWRFDGTSGEVDAADHPELDIGPSHFSVDAWIRPAAVDGVRPIVSKVHAPNDVPLGYALFLEDGFLAFSMSKVGGLVGATSNVRVSAGEWHLVAVTVQRGQLGGVKLYLDGNLVGSADDTLSGRVETEARLTIGAQPALGRAMPARHFAGLIDEVEIFRRAVTQNELRAIHQAGSAGKCKPAAPPQPGGGALELVNVDAYNQCGVAASGFRFELTGFTPPLSSVRYPFREVFETPCTGPLQSACNPFTPPKAAPVYEAGRVLLEWPTAAAGATVPPGQSRHFGYTVEYVAPSPGSPVTTSPAHIVRAEYLFEGSTEPCFNVAESTQWSVPVGDAVIVSAAVRNESRSRLDVTAQSFASTESIELADLVSTNLALLTRVTHVISGSLAPGGIVQLGVPVAAGQWGIVLISDWQDPGAGGPTKIPRMRAFHALPVAAYRDLVPTESPMPTAVPSPTRTVPPVPTATGSSTDPAPTATTAVPSASATAAAPTATGTRPPTGVPTVGPEPEVCDGVVKRVPPAAVLFAVANPRRVEGWGLRCQPNSPPGPFNGLRQSLAIRTIARPYHPLFNALIYRCGCP